jgi:hypothetical protein
LPRSEAVQESGVPRPDICFRADDTAEGCGDDFVDSTQLKCIRLATVTFLPGEM